MSNKKKLVVLTGAGISAESGVRTFRDMNGLWEDHDIMEVASYQGWLKNKNLVLDFYNKRRNQLATVKPNYGHIGLVELEEFFDVTIITQNVDDLHERAGSKSIVHLHGELIKARGTQDESLIYEIGYTDINNGDFCELGSQLRPHIVWFGEMVPEIERAADLVQQADIFVIIGTSMQVYPAAGLISDARDDIPIYYIDPNANEILQRSNVTLISENASTGVKKLKDLLISLKTISR